MKDNFNPAAICNNIHNYKFLFNGSDNEYKINLSTATENNLQVASRVVI